MLEWRQRTRLVSWEFLSPSTYPSRSASPSLTESPLRYAYAYCPIHTATPTRLNCRVETRRRYVLKLNSQLVYDGFGQKLKDKRIENLSSRVGCRIGNWITTADGWVHSARHNSTQLNSTCSVFKFSTKSVDSRRELVANVGPNIHPGRRHDSTRQLSRVGVGRVYWA